MIRGCSAVEKLSPAHRKPIVQVQSSDVVLNLDVSDAAYSPYLTLLRPSPIVSATNHQSIASRDRQSPPFKDKIIFNS